MMKKTPNEYYKNRLTPPKAFFEWCYSQMPTYVWKNKEKTIIASDRKHDFIKEKRLTKNSRLTFFDKKETFEIILSTSKRIERQFYEVFSLFDNGIQYFEVRLLNLHVFTNNAYIKIHRENEENYTFGLAPVVGMFNYYAQPSRYPNNWVERLERVSELKYINLEELSVDLLQWYYRYRDRIEMIQKMGAKGIEKEFNQGRLDFRIVTMNWLKRWKLYLRNSTHTFSDVRLKQKIEQLGGKFVEGIEPYLSEWDIEKLPKEMSLVRFQNYLIRQEKSFGYYKDYIGMLEDLKREITNKRRFPKNLAEAHDEAVDTLNALEHEAVREEYEIRKKELSELELTIDNFVFVLPSNANELIKEGRALKHCVGASRYINGHAEGTTTIVFVRRKEKMNESFFTIEYKKGKIKQLQGVKNEETVPKELEEASEKWLKRVNQLMEKGGQQVA
ncbi:hypothetical protein A5819_003500 [Enterococcus sp. 7E2_DIV0204]|uniref:PcfJ domain-containing protein n=1 Tax=unclassified Enterococcus TaxID=2608891 RepID=UPI000B6DCF7A|nr:MULTISPECIES: PcfJ domain-containing protein [unclassified Enterococcus]OTN83950.1 hypothetical protein A5819_003500 [Enterococcus sp. 7E2_DIV0204]OTP46858.1 hypothetical protein A5884_003736 [Enterococcus sp. 7D2_DIV0200]